MERNAANTQVRPEYRAGHIAIVGSGFIGQSWAVVFARAGFEVRLYDVERQAVSNALERTRSTVLELESHALLARETGESVLARIRGSDSLEQALKGALHVQENVPEDLEIKRTVFRRLDSIAEPRTIIASSTSALMPSAFTEGLAGAERCVVAHPINPPHLVPAVEVVPSARTSSDTVHRTAGLMRSVGQSVIVLRKEIAGFIVNRLQGALLHEAFRLFSEEYADIDDIDACMRDGLGLRWSFMGPFETIDLNAPGGISDYIARYGPFYSSLWGQDVSLPDWQAASGAAEQQRSLVLKRKDLEARQAWRDRKLIALAALRRFNSESNGKV